MIITTNDSKTENQNSETTSNAKQRLNGRCGIMEEVAI